MIRPWYVLTGGPCAGKTTLIEALSAQGYRTVPEAARTYIEQELAKGRTLEEIRRDEITFQHALLPMKIEAEKQLPEDEIVFFDRGMHDSIAYLALQGVEQDPLATDASKKAQYKKVFLLDRLPLVEDGARIETEEDAARIHELLHKSYVEADLPVIRVPVMSLEDRVAFVLGHVEV